MNQEAWSIGDLAAGLLSSGKSGRVTRVFQRSAYIRSGEDFLLLLWGDLRSPMTINVEGKAATDGIHAGETCRLSSSGVDLDSGRIGIKGADVYSSALLDPMEVTLPGRAALTKGVALLRSLYDVSPSGPTLDKDTVLRAFSDTTLRSLASGERAGAYSPSSYLRLIGRGGGFTPAGDDFVSGFVATFNFLARCRRSRQIRIPRSVLSGRTVPESANVVFHSARGYVDEEMERLVIRSLDGGPGFTDELIAVAHRGHTSGIDMSLGVILCEAAITEADGERGALEGCLKTLWHP